MKKHGDDQQKLMELVVDKVLKKHGVIKNKEKLAKGEKKKIANIVENIKSDVEEFLVDTTKAKTEKDFPEVNSVQEVVIVPEPTINKKTVYKSENNVNAVKIFLNN